LQDLQPLTALAVLSGASGDAEGGGCSGEILFSQPNPGTPVLVTGNVTGLSAGLHGFHIHLKGDMREGCESVGPHFNPYLVRLFSACHFPFSCLIALKIIGEKCEVRRYVILLDSLFLYLLCVPPEQSAFKNLHSVLEW
jgi:hypothetical protein